MGRERQGGKGTRRRAEVFRGESAARDDRPVVFIHEVLDPKRTYSEAKRLLERFIADQEQGEVVSGSYAKVGVP